MNLICIHEMICCHACAGTFQVSVSLRVYMRWMITNHRRANGFAVQYYTGARTRRYNIAASWAVMYCLTPGPRVSLHHSFSFQQKKASHTVHTLSLSSSIFLILIFSSSFCLFIFCSPSSFLAPSFCFWPSFLKQE